MSSALTTVLPRTPVGACAAFVVLATLAWLGLYVADQKLMYVHAGSDLIYELKSQQLSRRDLFPTKPHYRVIAMGNSKTLSAFRPDVFDAQFYGKVASYNFGLPGDSRFIPLLTTLLESGNRPTHVLLQEPWSTAVAGEKQPLLIKDDKRILSIILPFRKLPRDFALFTFQARKEGFSHEWDRVKREVDGVANHRGWYFISAQSHYPNDELPPNFRLPNDTPSAIKPRDQQATGPEYSQLLALSQTYNFKVLLVPHAIRIGQAAAMPDQGREVISASPYVASVGPHYWALPVSNFSDPVHMNVPGSERYTRQLAEFLKQAGEFE